MPYYIIRIADIPADGCDLNAISNKEAWFKKVVEEAASDEVESFNATLSARIHKMERSVDITGGVYIRSDVVCSRCLKLFNFEQQIPFRFLLEPSPSFGGEDEESEDFNEVLDFSYYDGDEIDIGDLVRQHIMMAQPINHLCREDCKGLCPKCGKDLNKGGCGCKKDVSESPFNVLKAIKPRSQ